MCRALQVVCVAGGKPSLTALKRSVTATEWELTRGATTAAEALEQLEDRKAHVLVTWGAFGDLVTQARERFPGLRIVSVGRTPIPKADVNLTSIKGVRGAILGVPPVGGPVRTG
jgi:hypothetical protein